MPFKKKFLYFVKVLFVAGFFIATLQSFALSQPGEYKPGEILIKFKPNIDEEKIVTAAKLMGLTSQDKKLVQQSLVAQYGQKISDVSDRLGVSQWRVAESDNLQSIIKILNQSPLVEYVEPNYIRTIAAPLSNGPNDPYYQNGNQWWLEAVEADRAFSEGLLPQTNEVIVAIVDTGIRLDHQDLSAQLVAGVTIVNQSGYTPPADGMDDDGHGTHVAGIVSASTDNAIGIAGTACSNKIKLMPIKTISNTIGGYDSDIASGIVWAVEHGAQVLNLSFGNTNNGKTLQDACDYAYQQGCVVLASAGNFAQDGNPVFYPAAYNSVIAVAATTIEGTWADYSEVHDYVDLAAPGGHDQAGSASMMLSTYNTSVGAYAYNYGTSMASPVAAGVAALLLSQNPNLTPDEVKNRLCVTAKKIGSLVNDSDGWNPQLGWGQVNVYNALNHTTTFVSKKNGRASYNFPNPFQPARGEKTEIVIPAERNGASAKLTIFDAMGRKVFQNEISGSLVYPGATTVWDGRDEHGNWVANGVYFYRLDVSGKIYENKIAVLNQ